MLESDQWGSQASLQSSDEDIGYQGIDIHDTDLELESDYSVHTRLTVISLTLKTTLII